MITRVKPDRNRRIDIFYEGDENVTEVCFENPDKDLKWVLNYFRRGDKRPYSVPLREEENELIWTVTLADTAKPGMGIAQLVGSGEGQTKHSGSYSVCVGKSLTNPGDVPAADKAFLDQVAQEAAAAQASADRARELYNKIQAGLQDGSFLGPQGEKGEKGDPGQQGPAGPQGEKGDRGEPGPEGPTGPQGPEGPQGETGPEGPAGPTGPQGLQGERGLPGATGAKGDTGPQGEKGDTGDVGPAGPQGPKGESGKDGKDGKDGLDAPQIDDEVVSGETPWSSRKIIETLCPPIEEAGNLVTCYPVAGYPLGAVASWEPTQAGTGEPYPAGGGPNLLDISKCTAVSKSYAYGLTVTINGDVVGIAGTPTVTADFPEATFRILFSTQTITAGYKAKAFVAKGKITRVTTILSDKSIVVEAPLSPDTPVDIQLRIMFYTGTEPTAYAPYENIRPISGRDAVQVERCGENLLKITPFAKITKNGIEFEYIADGGIRIAGTSTASTDSPTFPVPFLAPGIYYGIDTGGGIGTSIVITRDRKRLWLDAKKTFEIQAGDVTHYWYMICTKGTTINKTVYPYIVPGSTPPTAYTPYRGDTYTLALPETVYGGTVDAVTGDGQETWKLVTLDGSHEVGRYRESEDTDVYKGFVLINAVAGVDASRDAICSHFEQGMATSEGYHPNEFVAHHPAGHLYLRAEIPGVTSVDTLRSWLAAQYAAGTPVQIAYKLAKPVAFEATGAAGEILPIPGEVNTIMTDADSLTVTGRADPIHIIQALQAAQSVATQQLAETQAAVVDTTAMAVDYIYEQDSQIFGGDEDDDETDTVLA